MVRKYQKPKSLVAHSQRPSLHFQFIIDGHAIAAAFPSRRVCLPDCTTDRLECAGYVCTDQFWLHCCAKTYLRHACEFAQLTSGLPVFSLHAVHTHANMRRLPRTRKHEQRTQSPLSHVSGIKLYVAQGRNTKQHTFQQSRSMCDDGKVCYRACEIGLACTKQNIQTKYAHRVHALASTLTQMCTQMH